MQESRRQERDPLGWCLALALAFLALGLVRLGLPTKPYFDETHYVPAARDLLRHLPSNREHPLFAKEVLAASIHLLGDRPFAWRIPALALGTLGLFAFGRLIWWTSRRRFAPLAGMLLLATNFMWFVQSRIAMLDIFAAALALTALWTFAAAARRPEAAPRPRLALCGILLGLALGAKWSAVPLAFVPGIAFVVLKLWAPTANPRLARLSLVEAGVWLGLLPLLVYWTTFAPSFFLAAQYQPASVLGFVEQHARMIGLQDSVTRSHPYQSVWQDWVINRRPIWYLYEFVDDAQRGVLLLGNPFTMLAGLPALAWCCRAGLANGRRDALAFAGLYALTLFFWPLTGKPVQFYYHYLLPGCFLMGCLALALDALMRRGGAWRFVPFGTLAASVAMFAWFYPILSSAALPGGPQAFAEWMWLDSWR